ncbi:MFS transporter [uncultured Thiodictyon sp.]|uniref:MFS transporter n=1 Tax=uncultured Thiodictyon sp. TaxID=1846217 RepID=UPI0025E20AA4|nr:MFS transporter [uncultured Thiodictyon sp.]
MTSESRQYRLGFLTLAPGILPRHAWSLLVAAFFSIGLMIFISVGQTYVLNALLKVPVEQQGSISGNLVFWTELITLALFMPAGILMDRIGRRSIYAVGLLLLAATYVLYSQATSVHDLYLYRIVYACSVVAVAGGLSTVMVDYPAENSRGKLVATLGFLSGLGVAFIQGLGALPQALIKHGWNEQQAGLITHLGVAGLAVAVAVLVAVGLKGGTPMHRRDRPGVRELFVSGFAAARNPRILLAYSAAFIARGDQSVNAIFMILWGTTAGLAAGMGNAQAVKQGMFFFVIAQVSALLWSPVLGPLLDRLDRATALGVCMLLAAIGNFSLLFLESPLSANAWVFSILIGIGQISVYLGAQSLIGQEAPTRQRGSIIGAFNVSGAIGILAITWLGGRLFDHVAPCAPFVLVGLINLLLVAGSLYVRVKAPRPPMDRSGEGQPAAGLH